MKTQTRHWLFQPNFFHTNSDKGIEATQRNVQSAYDELVLSGKPPSFHQRRSIAQESSFSTIAIGALMYFQGRFQDNVLKTIGLVTTGLGLVGTVLSTFFFNVELTKPQAKERKDQVPENRTTEVQPTIEARPEIESITQELPVETKETNDLISTNEQKKMMLSDILRSPVLRKRAATYYAGRNKSDIAHLILSTNIGNIISSTNSLTELVELSDLNFIVEDTPNTVEFTDRAPTIQIEDEVELNVGNVESREAISDLGEPSLKSIRDIIRHLNPETHEDPEIVTNALRLAGIELLNWDPSRESDLEILLDEVLCFSEDNLWDQTDWRNTRTLSSGNLLPISAHVNKQLLSTLSMALSSTRMPEWHKDSLRLELTKPIRKMDERSHFRVMFHCIKELGMAGDLIVEEWLISIHSQLELEEETERLRIEAVLATAESSGVLLEPAEVKRERVGLYDSFVKDAIGLSIATRITRRMEQYQQEAKDNIGIDGLVWELEGEWDYTPTEVGFAIIDALECKLLEPDTVDKLIEILGVCINEAKFAPHSSIQDPLALGQNRLSLGLSDYDQLMGNFSQVIDRLREIDEGSGRRLRTSKERYNRLVAITNFIESTRADEVPQAKIEDLVSLGISREINRDYIIDQLVSDSIQDKREEELFGRKRIVRVPYWEMIRSYLQEHKDLRKLDTQNDSSVHRRLEKMTKTLNDSIRRINTEYDRQTSLALAEEKKKSARSARVVAMRISNEQLPISLRAAYLQRLDPLTILDKKDDDDERFIGELTDFLLVDLERHKEAAKGSDSVELDAIKESRFAIVEAVIHTIAKTEYTIKVKNYFAKKELDEAKALVAEGERLIEETERLQGLLSADIDNSERFTVTLQLNSISKRRSEIASLAGEKALRGNNLARQANELAKSELLNSPILEEAFKANADDNLFAGMSFSNERNREIAKRFGLVLTT